MSPVPIWIPTPLHIHIQIPLPPPREEFPRPELRSSAPPLLRSSAPPLLRSSAPPLLRSSAPPLLRSSAPPLLRSSIHPIIRSYNPTFLQVSGTIPLTQPHCNFRKFLRNFPALIRKLLALVRKVLPKFPAPSDVFGSSPDINLKLRAHTRVRGAAHKLKPSPSESVLPFVHGLNKRLIYALVEDVLRHLPTYDDLDELWCSIPSYAPLAFSSDPQVDHSSHLLSIMHTKSAPASTSTAGSGPALDDDEDLCDVDTNELGGPAPSHNLPPTNHTQQLPQAPSNADNNNEYDILDDSAMGSEVNDGDSEVNADGDKDYEMSGYETVVLHKNRVDKRPRPFSPSPPPPETSTIASTTLLQTPVSDSQASFTPHANRAFNRTSLSKPRLPPPSITSSMMSSSAQSCSSSGSVPSPSPTTNTLLSSKTKAKSAKHVRSDVADVRDKAQMLAQGVVSEHYTAKADQKMLKLQIYEKEWDQMFLLNKDLIQQSHSLLDHQRTLESKNADICLKQAKAQTYASEMELLHLKLQLGEQQLQLKLQHDITINKPPSPAS
ncbi:hypothetical protein EV424DRAFT_1584358 [Suillus variegatus]|nr:hypothetical protein EV424DRAFT_1584358 [Suillus variegatus]